MSQASRLNKIFGGLRVVSGEVKTGTPQSVNIYSAPIPVVLTTTATVLPAASVFSGIIVQAPASALTVTFDTAVNIIGAIAAVVNDSFNIAYINQSSANIATIAVGTGGTIVGTATVPVSSTANFRVIITSPTTYSLYRL